MVGRLLDEWRLKSEGGEGMVAGREGGEDQTEGGEFMKVSLLLCILAKHFIGSELCFPCRELEP